MAPKFIGLMFFIWLIGVFLGSISEGSSLFANTNVTPTGQDTLQWWQADSEVTWGRLTHPAPSISYFQSIYKMATLDFPLFTGTWEIVRWFVLGPIVVMVGFGLIAMFFNILRQNV